MIIELRENKDIKNKLYSLASTFRNELEAEEKFDEDDIVCFKGRCQDISPLLAQYLKDNGFEAHSVFGKYNNVSDEFSPDMTNWDTDDIEYYLDTFDNTWLHHFVIVTHNKKKYIVDVTADQFHDKEEKNDYKVVVEDYPHSYYSLSPKRK